MKEDYLSLVLILISQYFYRSQNFHSYMIDIFIAYRQYVFDDSINSVIIPSDQVINTYRTTRFSYLTIADIKCNVSYVMSLLIICASSIIKEHYITRFKQVSCAAAITSAIVDRLTYKAYLLYMEGNSYRLR